MKKQKHGERQAARRHGCGRECDGCGKGKAPVNQRLNLEESTSGSDPDTSILKDLAALDQSEPSDVHENETTTSHIS